MTDMLNSYDIFDAKFSDRCGAAAELQKSRRLGWSPAHGHHYHDVGHDWIINDTVHEYIGCARHLRIAITI